MTLLSDWKLENYEKYSFIKKNLIKKLSNIHLKLEILLQVEFITVEVLLCIASYLKFDK